MDVNAWEAVYDAAETKMQSADWADQVLQMSQVESLFLTNDFDDPLQGFDTQRYIPCLRTDDLVFHFAKQAVRARLEGATQIQVHNLSTFRDAIEHLFKHFTANNARACAISLPPTFAPEAVSQGRAESALEAVLIGDTTAHERIYMR